MDINTKKQKYVGKTFNYLEVMDIKRVDGYAYAICKCVCGNKKSIRLDHVLTGNTKSCGCKKYFNKKPTNVKHNESRTRLYKIWVGMKGRCFNPRNSEYKNYGGRGITVCDEWLDYISFRNWAINNGYTNELTIERINVDLGYCSDNCKWIPLKEQLRNTTRTIYITYNGETLCANDWAKRFGIPHNSLVRRFRKGLPLEEVFKIKDGNKEKLK